MFYIYISFIFSSVEAQMFPFLIYESSCSEYWGERYSFKIVIFVTHSEVTFSQRRRANDQQIHKRMLNITIHQENANQNHNEILPHIC